MSLLEQAIIKKKQINKTISQPNLNNGDSKKYKIQTICNNMLYTSNSNDQLPDF